MLLNQQRIEVYRDQIKLGELILPEATTKDDLIDLVNIEFGEDHWNNIEVFKT